MVASMACLTVFCPLSPLFVALLRSMLRAFVHTVSIPFLKPARDAVQGVFDVEALLFALSDAASQLLLLDAIF